MAANSSHRATASGHSPGVDGCAVVALSAAGAGPTAKMNELLTGSPSAEITCQATVYTSSPSRAVTGTVTTLRPRLCRGGPTPIFCPPAPVSVTGGPARVTGSLKVSVIAVGEAGTAESAAGAVNSSVAWARACRAPVILTRGSARHAGVVFEIVDVAAQPGDLGSPARAGLAGGLQVRRARGALPHAAHHHQHRQRAGQPGQHQQRNPAQMRSEHHQPGGEHAEPDPDPLVEAAPHHQTNPGLRSLETGQDSAAGPVSINAAHHLAAHRGHARRAHHPEVLAPHSRWLRIIRPQVVAD